MTEIEIRAASAAERGRLDDEDAAAATVGLAKWLCLAALSPSVSGVLISTIHCNLVAMSASEV